MLVVVHVVSGHTVNFPSPTELIFYLKTSYQSEHLCPNHQHKTPFYSLDLLKQMSSIPIVSQDSSDSPSQHDTPPESTEQSALGSDEAALLADFDRYIQSDVPLEVAFPSHSSSQTTPPTSNPTSNALPPLPKPPSNAITALKSRFSKTDYDSLSVALTACNGDVETATTLLIQSGASCTDGDEQLARQLQRRESQNTTADSNVTPRHRRNNAPIPLSKSKTSQLVTTLREIVVPSLRAHFEDLSLPNTTESSSSFQYSFDKVQIINLSMPLDNVGIKPAADGQAIYINIVNIYLELEIGKWSYQSNGIVPVQDSGRARVSVHRMNISITLEPRWSHAGGTRIVITDCTVTVDGPARFKTYGAAADWAYNAIALVLKPFVVSYLKEAVADSVTEALGIHLRQLAFAYSLDEPSQQTSHPRNTSTPAVATADST